MLRVALALSAAVALAAARPALPLILPAPPVLQPGRPARSYPV
ncbi:hypothetical protein [Methylobacterium sp. CCH5-D2]|nr:hypothetical protein [Methylobacterium sp. CCH5-D2]